MSMKLSVEEVIRRIKEATGLSEEFIKEKIESKKKELYGLVSDEGAALIVANEFGIKITKGIEVGRLQIKNLIPGLKKANILGRVIKIYPVRRFEKGKIRGEVGSMLIGDETGKVRVVIWDERVKLIKEGKIKVGDLIRVVNGSVKESSLGLKEVHLRRNSKLEINPETTVKIPELDKLEKKSEYSEICRLEEGVDYQIRGAIVDILGLNFFEICPYCEKPLKGGVCEIHGKVIPSYGMALPLIIDDGTGNLRVVLFGKRAERLLEIESRKARKAIRTRRDLIELAKERNLLGREIVVSGKVVRKRGNLEMIASRVIERPSPTIEAYRLLRLLKQTGV